MQKEDKTDKESEKINWLGIVIAITVYSVLMGVVGAGIYSRLYPRITIHVPSCAVTIEK